MCMKHLKKTKRGQFELPVDIIEVSDTFKAEYYNSGVMMDGQVYTEELVPVTESPETLGEVVQKVYDKFGPADESYYLKMDKVNKREERNLRNLSTLKVLKRRKSIKGDRA